MSRTREPIELTDDFLYRVQQRCLHVVQNEAMLDHPIPPEIAAVQVNIAKLADAVRALRDVVNLRREIRSGYDPTRKNYHYSGNYYDGLEPRDDAASTP